MGHDVTRTITVVGAPTGAVADVRLDMTPHATVGDVIDELARITAPAAAATAPATGATPATVVVRNGRIADPHTPLASLRDGDVLVLGAPAPPAPSQRVALVEVTQGPDAGRSWTLTAGRHAFGRTAALHSADPRVSRHHLDVCVDDEGQVTAVDNWSANGSSIDGVALSPSCVTTWPVGAPLHAGDTVLVHGRCQAAAAVTPAGGGSLALNRPPRLQAPDPLPPVVFPRPPTPATSGRIPVLASLAPLLAGVALALLLHRWEFLAFAVMSPLVVLGQAASDRWSVRRTNARAAAAYAEHLSQAQAQRRSALAAESKQRHDDAPDLGLLVAAARLPSTLLWSRAGDDDDALQLRLGLGSLPSRLAVEGGPAPEPLPDVPVCADLRANAFVGVCGDAAVALARSLLVQAATLHGPSSVRMSVLAPGVGHRWAWARWLPHLRDERLGGAAALAVDRAQLRCRVDELGQPEPTRRLVVVDGVRDPQLAATLAARPRTHVVWLSDDATALPAECVAVVTAVAGPTTRATWRVRGAAPVDVVPDLVAADVAEDVARAVAPLRDAPAAAALPGLVRWSSLHDVPLKDKVTAAAALRRRWASGPTTAAALGVGASGPVVVDLATDGPHVLVAGTTGSGKSELLQSLVASLVAGNSPADLSLLLVDFKGGAAFGPCARLPHTAGVLTDLDAAATSRALQSLTAELRRREKVLADAGVADIQGWAAAAQHAPGTKPDLSRLVIVVDEFATLAEELPDFVGGLVGIAQRGRSLGVHLVLATQRPEGAVSADIRANTRLRICLAVARDAESRDVIDSPRAVEISRATPGRAFVRIGGHELVEVQTARVAEAATAPTDRPVRVVPLREWGEPPARARGEGGRTELDLLVDAAARAASDIGATRAAPPWLTPLPESVPLAAIGPAPGDVTRDDGDVGIGLVDLPEQLSQPPLGIPAGDADPLLVVGSARSGRTTAALAITVALAARLSPDALHVFGIDGGRGLTELRRLPHTGAVVDARDADHVERLLGHLVDEMGRRRCGQAAPGAQLLLVVDGWDAVAALTDTDGGRCQDALLRVLTEGPAAGVRVVLTADRSGLAGRLATTVGNKICLRLADRNDFALLGVLPRDVPATMPPGRGIRAADRSLVQIATPDDTTWSAACAWPSPQHPPRAFHPLPARIGLHEVVRPGQPHVVVGVRGDDLAPVAVDPADTGGSFLIAGPPRSGRTTALVSMAAQLRQPVVALCARSGPLRRRRDLAAIADLDDADGVEEAVRAVTAGAALLVDDVDLIDDQRILDRLDAAVRAARDGAGFVVLAGATDAMSASFRGPVAQARRSRTGLLLHPEGPHDGDLLGIRVRRRRAASEPPGRGLLAVRGQAVAVQVPDPA